MDFDLPREARLVRRSVREFAEQTVAPLVEDMEQRDEFPVSLVRMLGDLGVLGLITPAEHGGSNLGHLARTVAIEEVSRVSAAVGISLQVHHMGAAALADFGTDAQKEKYLPALCRGDYLGTCAITEPTGGSDLLGMASSARPAPDGYVLTGRKCFITNCHLSDAVVTVVKTGEGPKGISAFVVEKGTAGFCAGRHEHKLGLRGADTGELIFRDCHVPRENLLGNEGDGMTIALRIISEVGRSGMAATALGILQACYDEAVRFAKERTLYGRPIAQLQAIQWGIADIFAQLQASRWLCYHAAWLKDSGRDCGVETTLAKMYVSEAAVQAAKKAIEIHGACGTMMEYPVQRLFRDAMVCVSAGGTTEVGKLVVSRAALA
ncbi:MAG TPA: acyl-CoA dehydrogenase family protein [Vicinamibacterales bacterium]|jgi:alkylation response protein AidB-like acyl-CoA dehydrogenase